MMPTYCVVGASGFIGRRTLARLVSTQPPIDLRVLQHKTAIVAYPSITLIHGDAADDASLEKLIVPDSVVLNFAFGGEHYARRVAQALGAASAKRGARRIVHLSSCSVYGRTAGRTIDEESQCNPGTPYERAKYEAERALSDALGNACELVLLRPSAAFGPGGRNLESLARRVRDKSWPGRYLRACAMGRRRMHVVDVECVAAAALFLGSAPLSSAAERFIVSQDDEPANDYLSIEAFLVQQLGAAPYPLPVVPVPSALLRLALRIGGRSDVEPQRRYSSARLAGRGFVAPRTFDAALREYAAWIARNARP